MSVTSVERLVDIEELSGKNVNGSGGGLVYGTFLEFTRRAVENNENPSQD
jgi:hypothetical protein